MPLEGDQRPNELKRNYNNGIELRDKTLGTIGFGRSRQAVARIAMGLGMRVLAYGPNVQKAVITLSLFDGQGASFTMRTVAKERLLIGSDFIALNNSPVDGGYVFDEEESRMMKDGVGAISPSGGGALNGAALVEATDHGKVVFAGLDMFENESNPAIRVLICPQISLMPHIGAATNEAQDHIGTESTAQIVTSLK